MAELLAHPAARSWGWWMRRAMVGLAVVIGGVFSTSPARAQLIGLASARDSQAMQQSRNIDLLLFQYSVDHEGAYPAGKSSTEIFQKLLDEKYATDAALFWIDMPGKTKAASSQLKPENVCFDVTAPIDSDAPDGLPLVFLTGYKITYAAGGSAVPLFKSTEGRVLGITVCYKNNRALFMKSGALPDGAIPNFVPLNFDPAGKKYQQLTPDGPLPDNTLRIHRGWVGWLLIFGLMGCLSPAFQAHGDDDGLPNFNAPQDNSPLNVDKVNRTLGIAMFKEPSLWDEDDIFVGKRLGWPNESRTFSQSSYRLYPTETHPVNVLGARAYSCVLYATRGRPTEVSIVFVNEGDYEWTQKVLAAALRWKRHDEPDLTPNPITPTNSDIAPSTNAAPDNSPPLSSAANAPTDLESLQLSDDDRAQIEQQVRNSFEKALKQDAQTITDALTRLFGDPTHEGFGGGSETRERVMRWDWQGHAFLLATPKDKYVTLRIVPVAIADNYGKAGDIARDDLKALLLQRVKRSDSGDVVVSEIPMVDQGPKGYCVPATWERYLRYLGIPADMYVLALAAGTTPDGGTDLTNMVENVDSLVTLYHRRIDDISGDLDMKMISRNIDNGLPIMWTCFIHIPLEKSLSKRMADRAKVTDWDAWATSLQIRDKDEIPAEITGTPSAGGHQRMIIGYNEKTDEIAISDSWSTAFAIRWMTLPEANAINAGLSYAIEP